jgi:hypothetical protein
MTEAAKPPSPNHVASRSGARENPVKASTEVRTMVVSGYFEEPAARGARM